MTPNIVKRIAQLRAGLNFCSDGHKPVIEKMIADLLAEHTRSADDHLSAVTVGATSENSAEEAVPSHTSTDNGGSYSPEIPREERSGTAREAPNTGMRDGTATGAVQTPPEASVGVQPAAPQQKAAVRSPIAGTNTGGGRPADLTICANPQTDTSCLTETAPPLRARPGVRGRERRCVICDDPFRSPMPNAKLCSKGTCRAEYERRRNARFKRDNPQRRPAVALQVGDDGQQRQPPVPLVRGFPLVNNPRGAFRPPRPPLIVRRYEDGTPCIFQDDQNAVEDHGSPGNPPRTLAYVPVVGAYA